MEERDLCIQVECSHCGEEFEIIVNSNDYNKYLNGMPIQKALPYLSAGERELILNGICSNCWYEMMIDWEYVEPMFLNYYRIQKKGEFNMIIDAEAVAKTLSISMDDYHFIQKNYELLLNHFKDEALKIDKGLMNSILLQLPRDAEGKIISVDALI